MDGPKNLPALSPEKGKHRLDKFKEHLVENKPLSARDQATFEKMKKAWGMANKMLSPSTVVTALQSEYGHEKTHAYQILKDSYELWGDAYELDKRGLTKTLVEAAHIALSLGVREKDAETILKSIKVLSDLHKLAQTDNVIPPNVAMAGGIRMYIVDGAMADPESYGKEVIDVESETVDG